MPVYAVSVEVAVESPAIDIPAVVELAERVMEGEGVEQGAALALLLTDDAEVRSMNRQFLGIDEPTDVLAFPDEADDFIQGFSDETLLGDIAIAVETALRQAREAGHSFQAELAHLLVHGILHLCGYDHELGEEHAARMRAREEHYLGPGTRHG